MLHRPPLRHPRASFWILAWMEDSHRVRRDAFDEDGS